MGTQVALAPRPALNLSRSSSSWACPLPLLFSGLRRIRADFSLGSAQGVSETCLTVCCLGTLRVQDGVREEEKEGRYVCA